MRKKHAVAAGVAAVAMSAAGIAAVAVPTVASASASASSHHDRCAAGMHAAVLEDNAAYNARDPQRYEAVLNPKMLFFYDGNVTYGRDAIMANARKDFTVPGWVWKTTILSETVFAGCEGGVAVVDAHSVNASAGTDVHFAVAMTMVNEHGKWTVGMDTVHRLPN
ncbi:nuclear transport factor 2 family protein [Labedaea rhizosphaerae]|uniref:Uncharacterized protein DUF4440 n=1 Tax=Labedaea rhizosphaerae TaxID=598644 RepID=A0A4R6RXW3_LABRH|nr:nuclear transport factor 2 family protein [Labedaea rhizosphaerae]TDP91843.1 uncharacterized protein DUF4440 [Labedaea rhizosphaerae]